jgi:hypothetical protein
MTSLRRWGIAVVFVLTSLACVRHRIPVLLHLPGSCVCTDYSEEVEGRALFNSFRDRSPESAANRFLEDMKQGRLSAVAPSLNPQDWIDSEHKPFAFEWRLRYRRDQHQHVDLYYQFTRLKGEPVPRWSGEGVVEVVETKDGWKASHFDVVW